MQLDFFTDAPTPAPPVELLEHASSDYAPRTGENARKADVTVAFAVDFTTAGEKLTHRVAGARYVGVPYGTPVDEAAARLLLFMRSRSARSLNVAGNGIYTLAQLRVSQPVANQWVYDVLKQVHRELPLDHVRSGGQTGIDTSGLVAGIALGIPVTGLYPKGYRQRLANKQDVLRTAQDLMAELLDAARRITP